LEAAQNIDPVFRKIVAEVESIHLQENDLGEWVGSPFAWIKILPSGTKGKIGKELVSAWCRANDLEVDRSPHSDADLIVAGRRMEIKMSTLWKAGIYKFQQFRDQDYEYGICLGISPFNVSCWILPKSVILETLPVQHGGQRGSDTKWLSFRAASPPEWLSPYGGTLSQALEVMRAVCIR
jgi:hypothetical protein